jgi:uncharacterized protein (TIGR02284 family)
MLDQELESVLHRLIETCRDAERGFRTAAEAVSDPALERLFVTYAQQRREFARELEDELHRLGGDPPRGGSVLGALHRAVINLRAAVSGRDERAVIVETERSEGAARRSYEDALARASLPADVRTVIDRQARHVREAHDRLRDLDRAA